jgi:ferredoxin
MKIQFIELSEEQAAFIADLLGTYYKANIGSLYKEDECRMSGEIMRKIGFKDEASEIESDYQESVNQQRSIIQQERQDELNHVMRCNDGGY